MRALVGLTGSLLVACAGLNPPGQIQVEVYRGLGGPSQTVGAILPDVHVLLDATLSMSEPSAPGASHLLTARTKAIELVRALPAGTPVALHAFGHGDATGDACGEVERLASASDRSSRGSLVESLRETRPAGEASAAVALETLARQLRESGDARDARVVLFTDLDAACGGDLCAAARGLVESGAWLDVVVHGDARPPSCLAELLPRHDVPGSYVRSLSPPAPGFRVEMRSPQPGNQGGPVARGRATGEIAYVPVGEVDVILELEPPLRLGPVQIQRGRLTRVRVLVFGAATGDWQWEILDAGG